jgi:hypothetical protein
MTRSGLARHLQACPQRKESISAADRGAEKFLYHLQVQDAWRGDFWLHLEMDASATLKDLDHYLRAIWLECCGHLSQFSVGGWRGDEIPMETQIGHVFRPGLELTHIYDFGTSSETLIKLVGEREGGSLTSHPIFLMARNEPPEATCTECGQPASRLCLECVYKFNKPGTLCEQHAEDHPHYYDYGEPMRLLNSPRTGMCGYDGPAEPPY